MTSLLLRFGAPLALVAVFAIGLLTQSTPASATLAERTEVGIGYYKTNQLRMAREVLGDVLRVEPSNFRALYGSGLVEYQDKQYAKAEAFLMKALDVKKDPEAYLTLGAVYRSGRAYVKAERVFRELRQDPKNAKAAYNLGMLMLERGRYKEAKDELTAYLRIEPAADDKIRVLKKINQIATRMKEAEKKK